MCLVDCLFVFAQFSELDSIMWCDYSWVVKAVLLESVIFLLQCLFAIGRPSSITENSAINKLIQCQKMPESIIFLIMDVWLHFLLSHVNVCACRCSVSCNTRSLHCIRLLYLYGRYSNSPTHLLNCCFFPSNCAYMVGNIQHIGDFQAPCL